MSHTSRPPGRHSALLKVVSETQDLRVFPETGTFRASSYVLPFDIPVRIENRINLQPKKQQEDDDSYTNERNSQSFISTNVFFLPGALSDGDHDGASVTTLLLLGSPLLANCSVGISEFIIDHRTLPELSLAWHSTYH